MSAGPRTERALIEAELRLPTADLKDDLAFFTETLGFRLERIFPADDPAVAVVSGHGVRLRLERGAAEPPGTLRLLCAAPADFAGGQSDLTAPNGTRIEIRQTAPPLEIPPTQHGFVVQRLRDSDSWGVGRAGMRYRDLIPGRLGGSIIASHIRIPEGGPVPDMVHYHRIGFQLIYCVKGWVRLVYEDQGPPFILSAGDCVTQPPEIRHRVQESSGGLEVIEVGVPAEHMTIIDHDLELPTGRHDPARDFAGQRFCHHQVAEAAWRPWRMAGFSARDSGVAEATQGLAAVQVVRRAETAAEAITSHQSDILFTFVLAGTMTLQAQGEAAQDLAPGDAFVVPPGLRTCYSGASADLELLEVALPGEVRTELHEAL